MAERRTPAILCARVFAVTGPCQVRSMLEISVNGWHCVRLGRYVVGFVRG